MRSYRWCKPPSCGIATICPTLETCRGNGHCVPSPKWGGAQLVVVAEIRGEVSLRLAGIQDDEKVQRVSADRSDEPFGVWILPRTSRRREHLFNTNRIFADYRCHEMRHR